MYKTAVVCFQFAFLDLSFCSSTTASIVILTSGMLHCDVNPDSLVLYQPQNICYIAYGYGPCQTVDCIVTSHFLEVTTSKRLKNKHNAELKRTLRQHKR